MTDRDVIADAIRREDWRADVNPDAILAARLPDVPCPTCGGSRWYPPDRPPTDAIVACLDCDGTGHLTVAQAIKVCRAAATMERRSKGYPKHYDEGWNACLDAIRKAALS